MRRSKDLRCVGYAGSFAPLRHQRFSLLIPARNDVLKETERKDSGTAGPGESGIKKPLITSRL